MDQIENDELNPRDYELNELFKSHSVRDFVCAETFDPSWNVYQTMRSHGFILRLSPLTGIGKDTDDKLKEIFKLNLADNTCLQFNLLGSGETQDILERWKNDKMQDPIIQDACQARVDFYLKGSKKPLFENTSINIRDFRLYLSVTFDGAFDTEEKREYLKNTRDSIKTVLKGVSINSINTSPDEYLNVLRQLWGCKQDGILNYPYDNRISLRDQIVEKDNKIYIDPNGIVINDTAVKTLIVKRYPENPSLVQMASLIGDKMSDAMQLSFPFLLTQNIKILNRERADLKLKKDSDKVIRQSKNGMGRFIPIVDKKAHEYKMLKDLFEQGESVVEMGHYLHLFTPLGKSTAAEVEAKQVFGSKSWKMVNAAYIQAASLLMSTPLMHDSQSSAEQKKLGLLKWMTQTNAANTMPIIADWSGTPTDSMLFVSRRSQLIALNIFDNSFKGNFNVAVAAKSGFGKSFFINELLFNYFAKNAKCWVIDVGRSYKFLCEAFNGQFIEFSESSKICINPFSGVISEKDEEIFEKNMGLIDSITDEKDEEIFQSDDNFLKLLSDIKDRIEMLKRIVMVAAGRENDSTEESYVEMAILNALKKSKSKTTFTTVYEELLAIEDHKGRTGDIALALKPYTKFGIHGRYFEGESNIDFSNRLTVLELEELKSKGKLASVVLLIMMLRISNEMYLSSREINKLCIIDEAWDLIGKGDTGEFIKTGYRRARKYKGSFITVTQSIDDYFMNEATKACWANSEWKFFLKQGSIPPDEVGFDEVTKMLLNSLQTVEGVYSELLIRKGNDNCEIARLIVDPFCALLYSSDANDVQMINNLMSYEKIGVNSAIKYLLQIQKHLNTNYNVAKNSVNGLLSNQISTYGYEKVKEQYGF